MKWFVKKKETTRKVTIGDEVEITGHNCFPGGDILPIGSVIKVEAVEHLHNAVVYVWNKEHNLDWWILPEDYKKVEAPTDLV